MNRVLKVLSYWVDRIVIEVTFGTVLGEGVRVMFNVCILWLWLCMYIY